MNTNPTLDLLAAAHDLLNDCAPDATAWQASRRTWLAGYKAAEDAAKLEAENNKFRAVTFRLLDAIRDAAIAGTDYPEDVNDAYDTVAPIFGLPLIRDIEKAEDSGDKKALAALADQGEPEPAAAAPAPQVVYVDAATGQTVPAPAAPAAPLPAPTV